MKLKNKNILIMREKLDKSQLRDTEQHIWPVLLKTVKAIKNSQEESKALWQLNVQWCPGWDSGIDKDISEN